MIALAISLLWFLFGAICLAGVIWLILYGIKKYISEIPEKVEGGIWFLFLLLVVIALLTAVAGGGSGGIRFPSFR